jgi:sialidase-1
MPKRSPSWFIARVVVLLLVSIAAVSCGGGDDDDADSATSTEPVAESSDNGEWFRSVVFDGDEDGIDTYRIPGAVVSDAGTILVFAEARSLSPHDLDPRRLVVRRSEDGGETWGPIAPVEPPDRDPDCDHTDPVPVAPSQGTAEGDVIVLFRSCGRLGSARSLDDGLTWGPRTDLDIAPTDEVPADIVGRLRAGPGHGIELREGDVAGRLVVSTDFSTDGATLTQLLVSDDGGESWRVGAHLRSDDTAGPNPDETALTELSDGSILVSARNGSTATPGRIQLWSSDGGETFDTEADGSVLVVASDLTVPVVQGALVTEPTTGLAVFSSPSDPQYRRGLRLWTSSDGRSWGEGPLVSQQPAAYSDLVAFDSGDVPVVGLVVETGDRGLYERIEFVRIPAGDLGDPGEALADDYDLATAVSGRVLVDGERFDIIRYCVGEERIELDGGWIEPDLTSGLEEVGFRAHVDDRGDGTPLDLDGTAELQLESGIRFRGSIDDLDGVSHEVDLVMVNMEICP